MYSTYSSSKFTQQILNPMKSFKKFILIGIFFILALQNFAQNKQAKFNLNEDGTRYIRITGLAQVWVRNTEMNPGTTINGFPKDNYTDFSIRRLRFQIYGQLTDRVFFYSQFGQNNFNYRSTKYTGAFFHDGTIEYAVNTDNKLSIGGGLTAWSGLARYASPSVGTFLGADAPLYMQSTNGINDQFLRKLSIYAKGQLGKFDYRVAITQAMTITNPSAPALNQFSFSDKPASKQLQGYFKFMFLDKESNLTPYHAGSYLGTKSIFNIGAGFIQQSNAMWALNAQGDTIESDMLLLGADVFLDKPIGKNKALTAYAAYTNYDFGKKYIHHVGVNNPANGSVSGSSGINYGNAFPMIGTGSTVYAQAGLMFGENVITKGGKAQIFASSQYSDYDFSNNPMLMYEIGANYFVHGKHNSKISFVYQSRPTYKIDQNNDTVLDQRKGMYIMQYQVAF